MGSKVHLNINMSDKENKIPCWDCRKRSLICDYTRPACHRCIAKGLNCAGYDGTPPRQLKWLAPGRVSSRNRRSTKKDGTKKKAKTDISSTSSSTPASREVTPHVTSPGLQIRTDATALGEAVEYYNSCIYPEIVSLLQLGPQMNVYPISREVFARTVDRPDYLRYGLVCMVLMHRSNRLRDVDPEVNALQHTFLHFRGVVIRSLLEAIATEETQKSNIVLAGTLNLLLLEAHQSSSEQWRFHLQGLNQLIGLRGGARAVAQAPGAESILPTFAHTAILSDSTSPASDMLISTMVPEDFEFIVEEYGSRSWAFAAFPSELFREVININHLRSRSVQDPESFSDLTSEGYKVLTRIHMFVPEVWAYYKPWAMEEWISLARLNQAAIALYCILSLQSISVLPDSASLRSNRITLASLVKAHLDEVMESPRLRRYLAWYFVVLGVQAVHTGGTIREYVRSKLTQLSYFNASYRPLAAKEILETFWASGKTTWDECFDKPYALCPQWSGGSPK